MTNISRLTNSKLSKTHRPIYLSGDGSLKIQGGGRNKKKCFLPVENSSVFSLTRLFTAYGLICYFP